MKNLNTNKIIGMVLSAAVGIFFTIAIVSAVGNARAEKEAEKAVAEVIEEVEIEEVEVVETPVVEVVEPTGMTLAELATHNTVASCYVAYAGTVYDVTGDKQWKNCIHFGVLGGTDITIDFPHALSYFDGISVVGELTAAQVTPAPAIAPTIDDDHDED